jgi:nucleotide-binding universal stress UspA family protein
VSRLERLLVPVLPSGISQWVLPRARRLFEAPGASVTLLSVSPPGRAEEARSRLDPLLDALARDGIHALTELREGDPAEEIAKAAPEHDLIAMATHGRSGLGRLLSGSVAFKVLQHTRVPMLLVRPLRSDEESVSPLETSRPAEFRSILVPLDGSTLAEDILAHVEPLARRFDSRVVLFTAIPGGPEEAAARRRAAESLERPAHALASVGLRVSTEIRTGPAAGEALGVIRDLDLQAVAMTTHGRTGAARALYGSVAESILQQADVPLLVIRNRPQGTAARPRPARAGRQDSK